MDGASMDFFARQDQARGRSRLLIVAFLVAVVVIVAAVNGVIALLFSLQANSSQTLLPSHDEALVHLLASSLVIAIIGLGSWYKMWSLRGGGPLVAAQLGGRLARHDSDDANERQLLNIVEEMAIAAGMPVPQVFILEHEASINAFAAGFTPSDAVIGITAGAMLKLNRDQLQGVIAHEFSHILHGDMRLNMRMVGVIHGIVLMALSGWLVLRLVGYGGFAGSRRRRSRPVGKRGGGGGVIVAILLLAVALVVIGGIGQLIGRLIRSMISRQREYLADASAVQFTRNPEGIGGALKRIAVGVGSRITSQRQEEFSHLFFGPARKHYALFSLATHPPLERRIRAIDPSWDGTLNAEALYEQDRQARARLDAQTDAKKDVPFHEKMQRRQRAAMDVVAAGAVVSSIGQINGAGVAEGAAVLDALPERLREEARNPFSARAIVYGLLLDADADQAAAQMRDLQGQADPQAYEQTLQLLPLVRTVDRRSRLPLLDCCLPTLRLLTADQYERFRAACKSLILADATISDDEFILYRSVTHHCDRIHRSHTKPAAIRNSNALRPHAQAILAALAWRSQSAADDQQAAYAAAIIALDPRANDRLPSRESCGLRTLDRALRAAAGATPNLAKALLEACVTCVSNDGVIDMQQYELLRLVADCLDCPLPLSITPDASQVALRQAAAQEPS